MTYFIIYSSLISLRGNTKIQLGSGTNGTNGTNYLRASPRVISALICTLLEPCGISATVPLYYSILNFIHYCKTCNFRVNY